MSHALTAEELFTDLRRMPTAERKRFFVILSENAFGGEDMNHQELFGHLESDNFTAQEASEYLEVSMTTFRRYVNSCKLKPASMVGRNQMFAVQQLKSFKKSLRDVRG